jgi:Na+/melibiose symporter-like transporter
MEAAPMVFVNSQFDPDSVSPQRHGRWVFIIGGGIFATTLSQPDLLDLPIRNVLKDALGVPQQQMAAFFALGALPWYLKIFAGLLSDSIPLFGTRRRHYLIFSATLAGAMWLLLAYVPKLYFPLLVTVTATNAMLVMGSTVVGGLLVEAGQRLGVADRLVATRLFVDSACVLLAGPLAGFLAGLPFGAATSVGAAIALTMLPIVAIGVKEPIKATYRSSALANACVELRSLLRSRRMWTAAGFLFVVSVPQEFQTTLYYFQSDVRHIPPDVIGYLKGIGGVGSLLATLVYPVIHRRLSLRALLVLGIIAASTGAIIYVFYLSVPAAFVIEGVHGFLLTLGALAFMEVAVWSTPLSAAAMGFAFLMSALNAGDAVGDNLAAELGGYVGFFGVVETCAVLTLLLLCTLPLLPKILVVRREDEAAVNDDEAGPRP